MVNPLLAALLGQQPQLPPDPYASGPALALNRGAPPAAAQIEPGALATALNRGAFTGLGNSATPTQFLSGAQ